MTNYIYIFRHGQSTFNKAKKFTGWLNPGLTKLGKLQALKIARQLKNKKFQLAIQTKLIRSQQTLKQVLKFHPECKKVKIDNRMIERNYGKLNGTSHEAFIKNMGSRLYKLEVEGDAMAELTSGQKKKIKGFLGEEEYNLIHRGYNISPPGGESFADVEKRVVSFIKDITKLMKKQKINVAVSCHGNSLRLFRKIMEKASVKKTTEWVIPYDKAFTYKIN